MFFTYIFYLILLTSKISFKKPLSYGSRFCALYSWGLAGSLIFFSAMGMAQAITPVLNTPINGAATETQPHFAMTSSSLDPQATYSIAVSESPRTGQGAQYVNFWIKQGLAARDLNPNLSAQVYWDSSWIAKTRNGNPNGPAVNAGYSPAQLTPGKRYYWHVVSNTTQGTLKSNEGSFLVKLPTSNTALKTPLLYSPANDVQTSNQPQFAASPASLQANATYTLAVSEAPRAGANSQYVNFWVKAAVTSALLNPGNANRLRWGAGWLQKSRNGNPEGPAVDVGLSQAQLVPGKRYYWHIVGSADGEIVKSTEGSFVVDATPTSVIPQTLKYQYDALGRLVEVEDDKNGNRSYQYDPAGNRISLSVKETGSSVSAVAP